MLNFIEHFTFLTTAFTECLILTVSVRPRPRIAMLLAKSNNMAPPIAKRTWSDSISSGSSMESLLSVLGHDSYESPNDTSDDEIVVSSCKVPFAER